MQLTFTHGPIGPERRTEEGNTFPLKLTGKSYQWLRRLSEAVNLLSSFCCLPRWVSRSQLTSVAAGVCGHLVYVSCFHQVTPPASGCCKSSAAKSSSHGPWPYCPLHSQCWTHTALFSTAMNPTAIMAVLAWACTGVCRCVLACDSGVPCVSLFFVRGGAVWFCLARSAAQSCTNWVFMVRIQALIPIMQTIKNLRRTVFYNLILK